MHEALGACIDPSCMLASNREASKVSIEKSIIPSMVALLVVIVVVPSVSHVVTNYHS